MTESALCFPIDLNPLLQLRLLHDAFVRNLIKDVTTKFIERELALLLL